MSPDDVTFVCFPAERPHPHDWGERRPGGRRLCHLGGPEPDLIQGGCPSKPSNSLAPLRPGSGSGSGID